MRRTPSSWGASAVPHPKAVGSRAGTQHPAVLGDLVCPSCSSAESSSLFVGAGCSAGGEL